jgi:NAD(P)-dependent dehydrogenase (short-subunit alcohol dehydrogenase family)
MAAHGTGAIVNIAALAGHEPYSGLLVYSASKAGVLAATRGLALELAPSGVRVNSISPGPIDSGHADGLAGVGDEQRAAIGAAFIAGIPMGRIGEATEIAEAALFLASDASSFMTGADLFVDGGSHLT